MSFEIIKNGSPVYALITKPMRTSWVFVVTKIRMKFGEYFFHLSSIVYRNGFICITMKNINAICFVIIDHAQYIAWRTCSCQYFFNRCAGIIWYQTIMRAICSKGWITCRRCNCCPLSRVSSA